MPTERLSNPGDDRAAGHTLDEELAPRTRAEPAAHATLVSPEPTQPRGQALEEPVSFPSRSHLPTVARSSYDFRREIAQGGLGRIWQARDLRLNRMVAIKELLKPTLSSEARFLREIEATVKLQHPNIVALHEAGRWPDGQLFYAMSFVAGKTLLDVIDAADSLSARLALLPTILDVCEAAAFAHSEGVVHRDLKPVNVLVGRFGETVVIDWGLAKLVRSEIPTEYVAENGPISQGVTRSGLVVGTPPYMPPEQAWGKEVDETADVYALGAILYQALAGRAPYFETRNSDLLQTIRTVPPTPLRDLVPDLPPDLLAVVDKAMARDPSDRYRTASTMAQELQRFTRGRLVSSYSYRLRDLLRRFVERNTAAVLTAAVAILFMLVLGTVSVGKIRTERDAARVSEQEATRQLSLARSRASELIVARARALAESDPTAAVASLKQLEDPPTTAASVAARAQEYGVARWVLRGHTDSINCLDVSPSGDQIVSGGEDHMLFLWSFGSVAGRGLEHHTDRVTDCAFSPEGDWMASSSYDGYVTLWPLDTLHPTRLPNHGAAVKSIAYSADGQYLASASANNKLRLWHLADQSYTEHEADNVRWPLLDFRTPHRLVSGPHDGRARLWTPDGGYLTSPRAVGDVTTAQLWDAPGRVVLGTTTGEIIQWDSARTSLEQMADVGAQVTALATRAGAPGYVAAATVQGDVYQVDLATGQSTRRMRHMERVLELAISPDQRFIASGGWDRQVHVFDVGNDFARRLRGHTDVVSGLAFTPDERYLVTASWDKTLRVWPLRDKLHDLRSVLTGHTVGVHSVRFSPDGRWLASGGHDNTVRVWDALDKTHRVLEGHTDHVYRVIFSPDGKWLASSSDDRTVRLWSLSDFGQSRVLRGHEADVEELAFSPDGTQLVSASEDHTARLWQVASGESKVLFHDHAVTQVAFHPNGKQLLTSSRAGTIRSFDAATGEQLAEFTDHRGEVLDVSYSPDGHSFASADKFGSVVLRDLGGNRVERWTGLEGAHMLEFSPDSKWVAVSGATPHLWVCRVEGRDCRELQAHKSMVRGMHFSPDSRVLASGDGEGDVLLWDINSGEYRSYQGHSAPVFDVDFSPDGQWFATASGDETVRIWPRIEVPTEADLSTLLERLTAETVPEIIADQQ